MTVLWCYMDLSDSSRQYFGWAYLQVRHLLSSIILRRDSIFLVVRFLKIRGRHQYFYHALEAKVPLLFQAKLARFQNRRC